MNYEDHHPAGVQASLDLTRDDAGATFSPCRRYRYALWRRWNSDRKMAMWLMLNPSIADETRLDPTLRRCRGFSEREGCGGMVVANLFALVSTDPRGLNKVDDPIGPDNDATISALLTGRHSAVDGELAVICGWGFYPLARSRAPAIAEIITSAGHQAWCLGQTNSGAPLHPLYLAKSRPLEPWP